MPDDVELYQGQPMIAFASPEAWESWLTTASDGSAGVWLKLAKKGCAETTVTYAEALDVALCFGWIDGQKRPLSGDFWLQRFTPRTPRSKWSKINRDRAESLIAAGRMRPAGLREVEAARADGRWAAAYEAQSTATVPEDLQRALDEDEIAAAFFATLDRANRYAVLYRINEAKKPETRAARVAKFVAMLHDHQTLHPPRGRAAVSPPGSSAPPRTRPAS
jgi:uncharacterized protein YdeI (YjbR/CyaY-like superfamily)